MIELFKKHTVSSRYNAKQNYIMDIEPWNGGLDIYDYMSSLYSHDDMLLADFNIHEAFHD